MNKKMKIKFVDGYKIRNTIDPDFTDIHFHSLTGFAPKYYIPEGEVWVERKLRDEVEFLMKRERMLDRLMKNKSYQEARRILRRRHTEKGPVPNFVRRQKTLKGGTIVKYVDGGIVRRYLDPEYVLGGHGYVYDYIPKGEIWIDAKMDRREFKYTLLHERTEMERMIVGESYDIAHDYATVTEKEKRRLDKVGKYPGDAPKQ